MADPVFKELAYQALANNIIGGLETTAANPMTGVVDPYRGTAATANIPMLRRSASALSRDAGKGTRNFVVFPVEEQSLTILSRE